MESDAIGGAMNLVMKNAPGRFFINANISTGYGMSLGRNDFRSFNTGAIMDLSPAQRYGADYCATPGDFSLKVFDYNDRRPYPDFNAGISIGNRFFGHKLGVVASVSYQNNRRFDQSTFFEPYVVPTPENTPSFANMQLRKYSTQTERIGVHVKVDYTINRKHSISLYGLLVNLNEAQSRSTVDTMLSAGYIGAGSANVQLWERSRVQNQYIGNGTVKGEHQLTAMFKLDWTGALSLATNNMPGWGEFQTQHTVRNGMVSSQPVILPFKYIWQNNRDGDRSIMLNLAYAPEAWMKGSELKVGTLYRAKHRNSYYNSYDLYPKLINGAPQVFESVDKAEMYFTPVEAGYGSEINPNHYISDENILAAYIQVKIKLWNKIQILTGARVEETRQQFETSMPEKFEGKRGKINYTDFLPSFHLKYEIDEKQNLRFSYYKAICRPGFFEVIPYFIIGEDYKEGGNPYLKHTRAYNFDIRYEYFPTGIDQLLLGIFYKDIKDPIEHGYSLEGSLGAVLRPNNFGEAYNYGAEIVLTKYIGNFGMSLNYTFTRSQITTDKGYYGDNGNGEILTVTMPQTRPLQGQSMHVANVSLLYKNPKLGLDAQLSSVYTGKRILQLSPYYGLDYWQQPAVTLDFSTEKTILKNFSVFVKLNNILDIPVKVLIEKKNDMQSRIPFQKHPDYYLVQNDRFGQSGLIGFRYKLK
ncbi:MAG: TonB-dependent receptor [Bacteroidales bacterium]|jgi:outer membrane receptor protein involved in Fe transport|nr:TonB-dependent receptor [Bacteroidales bacterium]